MRAGHEKAASVVGHRDGGAEQGWRSRNLYFTIMSRVSQELSKDGGGNVGQIERSP